MLKKSLFWFWRLLLWLMAAVFVIMLIAAITIQFWVMPNITQYKNSIADFASKTIQQKVTIGDIRAGWSGINPHLQLNNIDIFDAQNRPALSLQETDLFISWLSLPMLEPHLSKLAIHAPQLTIRRSSSGEVFIAGISLNGKSEPTFANWALRQNQVEIDQAKVIWVDEQRNAAPLSLNQFNLQVDSPLWRGLVKNHRISISAVPSVGTSQPILMHADFYGNDVAKTQDWDGTIDLSVKNADLSAFKTWLDYPLDIHTGSGSADVKLKFEHHSVLSVVSDVAVQNLQLQPQPSLSPVRLRQLSGQIVWENLNQPSLLSSHRISNGYKISVNKLSAIADSGLQINNLKAEYSAEDAGEKSLNLQVAKLDLAPLQDYIAVLPLSDSLRQQISLASPQGRLENLNLSWSGNKDLTSAYQINAKFSQLGLRPQNQIPGFLNLTGEVKATQKGGQIILNTAGAELNLQGILRWPVPIDRMQGKLSWSIKNNITEITARDLQLSNPHLSGKINVSYLMDGIKDGYLDLTGQFSNGNAKYASFYYPIILGETTLHWLDTSILAGSAQDIRVTVKGRLADFPFVNPQNQLDETLGLFRVSAKLSDVLLEYGTGWPVIDKLGMNLLFEGKRMELNSSTGNILGNKIIKSKTTIPQLDADSPILYVEAEVAGQVSDGIQFVNKSPVRETTQGFTDNLTTAGTGKLNLSLKIPLQNLDASQYKGLYQIANGKLESPDIPALSQINGNLEFTETSLSAKNIKAYAFGSPLTFNLSSGKDKAIRVGARGKLTEDSLRQLLREQNMNGLSSYVSGSVDWTGRILIQKPRVNLSLRSDLNGLSLRFPAPLNKGADQLISLRLDKRQDSSSDHIFINYGNKISAKIARTAEKNQANENNKARIQSADIRFNSDSPYSENDTDLVSDNRSAGIAVSGHLDYLDADAWRYVIKNLSNSNKQGAPVNIRRTALDIDALDIFDRRINQLKISNIANKNGLQINLQSREISGDLQWLNQNNGKLIARLSNLTVPENAPDRISAVSDNSSSADANSYLVKQKQDYPALDITAEKFEFDKKNFGRLELIAFPQEDNWNIQKFVISSSDGTISGDGQWNNWTRSPNTSLNVDWNIKDLGKTLKRFGYPDTVKDGEGELKGKLSWPGSPTQFNTTRLNGELAFDMRKGQILQVQPGVGRLLGLVSLQSLPRRLTLDFRDLFSNGFAFDKINATVKINQGVMRSDNFVMTGPAADVQIRGETNLEKETQHLYVKVLPRISDSVSLAALAGGPLAGAVAFLAQKVLKDPLNKIVSTEYEIIGTWDNPQEVKAAEPSKPKANNGFMR